MSERAISYYPVPTHYALGTQSRNRRLALCSRGLNLQGPLDAAASRLRGCVQCPLPLRPRSHFPHFSPTLHYDCDLSYISLSYNNHMNFARISLQATAKKLVKMPAEYTLTKEAPAPLAGIVRGSPSPPPSPNQLTSKCSIPKPFGQEIMSTLVDRSE